MHCIFGFKFEPSFSFLVALILLLPTFSLELYQQMLAKALAHHFEAKLLLLDIADFSLKVVVFDVFIS